jgi:hypothetical protein
VAQRLEQIDIRNAANGDLQLRWRHLPGVTSYLVQWSPNQVDWHVLWVVEDKELAPDAAGDVTYTEESPLDTIGYYRVVPSDGDPDESLASPAVRYP